ncbi:hypothetical protein A0I81_10235 [Listeria monocytogenes]|uniref:Uncharacterized protein n=1 Tax=Listeria immobilis TaxID=2713502 RepID=A0ABR6SUV7_9LIST|nr:MULTISPECIES: hypothetical protein [Listeria]EAC4247930.1 hypothetical protein [Listeria monocytogenes]EAE2750771.1 hypothetical protein [Listeria monocytogenes]EAE4158342.1 hypothetical protein [Listeria monocytogenes]EAE4263383.1 hypothetical protein [Listeria monocytogenes]EAE4811147.1 hypothetical protein [Listeria monocytogenes]
MKKENERSVEGVTNDDYLDYELEKALEEAKTNEEYRKIIRAALGKWLQNLQNNNIKLESVGDLKTLIEADKILRN